VIHAAGLARDWGKAESFRRANVEATAHLLDAAEEAGCAEFVFVGSISVHGFGRHEGSTEEGPYYRLMHPYPASKLEAERAVLSRNRPGFRTSSLRLGYVYGPGDTTSTYRMLDAASKGAFGCVGRGGNRTSLVYVDEACAALALALGNARVAGQAVNIVGDEAPTWLELSREIYRAAGALGRPKRVPRALAWAAAIAMTAAYRLAGSAEGPPLNAFRVRRSTAEYVFSNAKARCLLGFSPSIGYREGLALAAAAYRAHSG
jgi:nucleoside-diphosphate-sugar epimerase